jgi:hypothetical protein
MSALWTGTPTSIRLDDLDVICAVLACSPTDLLICEPEKVAALRPQAEKKVVGGERSVTRPRLGKNRTAPPA